MYTSNLPIEARILRKMSEPFAAGLYEVRNASMISRHARAILRYAESVDCLPAPDGPLSPAGAFSLWTLNDPTVHFGYTASLGFSGDRLREKIENQLSDAREKVIAHQLIADLANMTGNPMAVKYRVGGAGWTHSILDYAGILQDGLPNYGRRIAADLAKAADLEKQDFFASAQEAFDALMLLLAKITDACPEGALKEALAAAAERPPQTFYEALVLTNFMYYVDCCDTIGGLDRYLANFYLRDLDAGTITPEEAETLIGAFLANVEANSGWHMILGGDGVPEEFTILCLRAQKTRRPNTGLKITADTSDAVWEAAFDSLQTGTSSPSFYNDRVYREGAVRIANIRNEDLPRIAYGGCTEFMVEGRSNVGSIDGGVNLLRILEGTILAELPRAETFAEFMARFKTDLERQIDMVLDEVDLNQQYKATYRPQLIRTLFVRGCLKTATEYNRGGARYNGSVINVAGLANVANSLYAIRAVFDGALNITKHQLLDALEKDFAGCPELHKQLLDLPKFGNNMPEVDALAKEVADCAFDRITPRRCWRGDGFVVPSTIMFVTYVVQGRDIQATPDGRQAGTAIADSCGPMQGTDLQGPTSMLTSTAQLPQVNGLGTLILNLRIGAGMLSNPSMRQKLKGLLQSYFDLGGMQVQLSVLDAEKLKAALKHPEDYENLIVRIGGYTEYFNRLNPELKQEVVARTEYL
jgi:formate C-acetyltransferase